MIYTKNEKQTYPVTYAFWYRQTTVQYRHRSHYFYIWNEQSENFGHHCLRIFLKGILLNKDWDSRSQKSNNSKPKIYYILNDLPY